ncbi:DoxX family protein [Corallococcus sp. CA053C]|uniref:DoxX family protein n=1 Tax=Corallococcus sp. CA053C TaxID=2316732 RepID=UPI000EA28333|nr:DoxX family protein [Corallococcus sp. CA053C]RKH07000.1 DoxX family protein [Corallococcus sp. CA053C]
MRTKLLYWVPTGLLAAMFLMSGTFNVTHQPNVMQVAARLGYPGYVATLLGVWKLLAAVTLVFGSRWPRLKEWAFAGLFFNLSGAIFSHVASNDTVASSVPAGVLLVLTGITYAAQRRFGPTRLGVVKAT